MIYLLCFYFLKYTVKNPMELIKRHAAPIKNSTFGMEFLENTAATAKHIAVNIFAKLHNI